MLLVLIVMGLGSTLTTAFCPKGCNCRDEGRITVTCIDAELKVSAAGSASTISLVFDCRIVHLEV